ncbi:hypothetical protein [Roseovarius sp. EL26]|uniref:NYN domain-containing protein n=1 Tax=Roseovarius sp. EL26 TaxID=2126672 RepID=UPI000EA2343E|nr:hypothetical protein [Roseovarius sp. EL26]
MYDFELLIALLGAVVCLGFLFWQSRRRSRRNWIAIDGSNVLYWRNDTPSLHTVRLVLHQLEKEGYHPVIWFDANVGYLIKDRYLGPAPLAKALGLSARQVIVAHKGTPADTLVIEGAKALEARIVTNDRFRDWAEEYPQVGDPALFVRGKMRGEALELTFGT